VIVWLAVGLVTLAILLVFGVALLKQVKRVAGAAQQFSKEVQPLLVEMRRDAERAQRMSERLQERREALRRNSRLSP
jgi:hypothetical protein